MLSRVSKVVCILGIVWMLSMIQVVALRITEVFVDGSDEYIELTNTSTIPFSGGVTIQGVKSQPLIIPALELSSGQSIVLGDSLSFLSSEMQGLKLTGLGLSMNDTQAVDVKILSGDEILDELYIDESMVRSLDGKMTSFSRVRDGVDWALEPTSQSLGVVGNMVANPGTVYRYSDGVYHIWSLTNTTPPQQENQEFSCSMPKIRIQEVYLGQQYSPYLELVVLESFEGELQLSGSALSGSFIIPSQMRSTQTRVLVASHQSGFLHTDNIIIVPDLLLGSGTLTLLTSDGHLIDAIIFDHHLGAWYRVTDECGERLMTMMPPSPGFDHQFLPYLGVATGAVSCPVPHPTPPSSSIGSSPPLPALSGSQQSGFAFTGILKISLIDYDPPGADTNNEKIGVKLVNGDMLTLSGWSIRHSQKTYPLGDGLLVSGAEHAIMGSFQLVNTRPLCVQLLFGDQQYDEACYDPVYHTSPYYPLISDEYDYTQLHFDMHSVVYDPPGADTDNESITLQLLSGWDGVDLSVFRLQVGTKSKKIQGIISSGQILTITGNFQMPNTTSSCVALLYRDHLYDEYCYTITPRVLKEHTPLVDLLADYTLTIQSLVYDPVGKDKDNEAIVLMLNGSQSLDLSQFALLVNGKTRKLRGVVSPGQNTLWGSFQFPNHTATCIELVSGKKIRDRYCYDPTYDKGKTGQILTGVLPNISIVEVLYDPPGKDTNREQIILSFDQSTVLEYPLSIHLGGKKYKLSDQLHFEAGLSMFSGTFHLPNTKATCIELLLVDQVLDRYCYDPQGGVASMTGKWDQLSLLWVLPNPVGKDKEKEKIAFQRSGQDSQQIDASVWLQIGKKKYSLSGHLLIPGENIITLSTGLPNTPQCIKLISADHELDMLCYPQANQGQRYYHYSAGSVVLPEVVQALREHDGELSKLQLKRRNKQVCLFYENHVIRCLGVSGSKSNAYHQQLLSLQRSYIKKIGSLYHSKTLHASTLDQRLHAYEHLATHLKIHKNKPLKLYGTAIKPTQLDRYVELLSSQDSHEHLLDVVGRQVFGSGMMDRYYDMLYSQLQ